MIYACYELWAVFHSRSFRAAADELGVSQLSDQTYSTIGKRAWTRLFNRTTRAVVTESARELLNAAENALHAHDAFARGTTTQPAEAGHKGCAMALAAETLVVGGLARLAQTHPDLEVEVIGGSDICKELVTGRCDGHRRQANFLTSVYAPSLRLQPLHKEHGIRIAATTPRQALA